MTPELRVPYLSLDVERRLEKFNDEGEDVSVNDLLTDGRVRYKNTPTLNSFIYLTNVLNKKKTLLLYHKIFLYKL